MQVLNDVNPLKFLTRSFILDVWPGPESVPGDTFSAAKRKFKIRKENNYQHLYVTAVGGPAR